MAITTIDGAIAGMQPPTDFFKALSGTLVAGRPHSFFYQAGVPAAAAAPTPGIGGSQLTSYAGQLPFTNPSSGNTYLARFQAAATQGGTLILADRLWHNSGMTITSNTEQTFTGSTAIPVRDINGASAGSGVYAGVEVYTATGAGTPTLTLKYNNTSGVEKTATNTIATVASSIAGSFYPISLAAGDTGVQKAVSLTQSATWTSGSIGVVLYRPIARLELPIGGVGFAMDALTAGFPRVYDNTVPFFIFLPSTTTTSTIAGSVVFAQG